nr:hypothetical protein [uncultured Fluviicola sp.]
MTLIENEITNSKLIFTLQNIGIEASDYFTDTSQVIFVLIGIRKENRTEELYKKYFELIKQVQYLDLQIKGEKSRLALKIYGLLIANL